jgi:integrase
LHDNDRKILNKQSKNTRYDMGRIRHEHKLTKRTVDAFGAEGGKRSRLWDRDLKGFCLQAYPTGRKVYVVGYTYGGRYRWLTIGKHGDPWTPEAAREKAKSVLGDVANGIDPVEFKVEAKEQARRDSLTVSGLIDRYLEEGPVDKPDKRASSWANDRSYLNNHARPLLGKRAASKMKPSDISKFQHDVYKGKSARKSKPGRGRSVLGGRGAASHAIRSLSAALTWAVNRELISENPCNKIEKLQDGVRERYLSVEEAQRLFTAIRELLAEKKLTQSQVDCIALISYTAARASEIKALRWREIDFDIRLLILPPLRHKTGGVNKPKTLPLTDSCLEILQRRQRELPLDAKFVFPSEKSKMGCLQNVRHSWERITARANLKDFRIHDFRHAYASFAINAGQSLNTIGANLGHKKASTTERYAHLLVETRRPVAEGVEAVYKNARQV